MKHPTKRLSHLKRFLTISLFQLLTFTTFSQGTSTVSGIVTDSLNNPLSGVSVTIAGAKTGTSTDANGKYSISVKPASIISFSSVGLLPQTIATRGRIVINVQMKSASSDLTDVVVIGK